MQLELDTSRVDEFERRMGAFGPWMHAYKLGDEIFTGYYKYEGLDGSCTFVNSRSPKIDIDRMRAAYASRRHHVLDAYVDEIFDLVVPNRGERASMRVLDLASASGQISIRAVRSGFGAVTSSEIRGSQSSQERLLLDSLRDPKYRERITVVNDPVSADAPEFPERYRSSPPDLVLSFGLLYHLTNPFQHLVNLHAITKRYVVIYTMTHFHPFAKNMWSLAIENAEWITKAASSISWTPHFLEVTRVCRAAGFRTVRTCYPKLFSQNFPEMTGRYTRWTDAKLLAQMALHRATGIRTGHMRNHDFRFFQHTNVNPNYLAYVCEK